MTIKQIEKKVEEWAGLPLEGESKEKLIESLNHIRDMMVDEVDQQADIIRQYIEELS